MSEPPVVNSSPLIVLARAELIELLQLAGDPVLVPSAVAVEVRRRGLQDPAARVLATVPWLTIVDAPPAPTNLAACRLDPGETAVLAWALSHPGTEAILDDRLARRCAQHLRIPVRGTLALVLIAKQVGVVDRVRPAIASIRRAGLYLSDRVVEEALRLAGE